jgi:hypothetical protein
MALASKYGRVVGLIVAFGTALLLGACAIPTPPPTPAQPSAVQSPTAQESGIEESGAEKPETSQPAEGETSGQAAPDNSGAQMDEDVHVTTYDTATGEGTEVVQRPHELLFPDRTGVGPSDLLLMDAHWARWDEQQTRGNCIVRITGGGAPPELVKGVRVILGTVENRNGTRQYTHYRLEWPDGSAPDEGELDYPAT